MAVPTLIYTANIAHRDTIRTQREQSIPVDWLYLTDEPEIAPAPWYTLRVPRSADHPNMAAKWWRTHPMVGYEHAIWIDANMEITYPHFAREAIMAVRDGIGVWAHPRRDCVYDEADASMGAESQGGRYANLPIPQQVAAYRSEGYPAHNGLYATGTLVWTPERYALAHEWYEECRRWGFQDQIAFPVVCWRHGVKPGTFPVTQTQGRYNRRAGWWGNAWLLLHDHNAETG
jgi:hypothetical protein